MITKSVLRMIIQNSAKRWKFNAFAHTKFLYYKLQIMDLYSEFSNEINLHDIESKLTLDILSVLWYLFKFIYFLLSK